MIWREGGGTAGGLQGIRSMLLGIICKAMLGISKWKLLRCKVERQFRYCKGRSSRESVMFNNMVYRTLKTVRKGTDDRDYINVKDEVI